MKENRTHLRRSILQKRASLTTLQQKNASKIISQRLVKNSIFLRSQRIAFYVAHKGEVENSLLVEKALSMGKDCFFPVLHPIKNNRLWFGRYCAGDPLKKNFYGILEPILEQTDLVEPWSLDLVITPLVAFDHLGHRLGMGGGFYDRTFSFRNQIRRCKPILLGLAYDFQEVAALHRQEWDVSLNGVVTESRFILF